MKPVFDTFRQNRQVWAWAVIVSLFLVVFGHAPVLPVITGGLLAVVLVSLRALSAGQKKPWQREIGARR